jgi:hypothetical protein
MHVANRGLIGLLIYLSFGVIHGSCTNQRLKASWRHTDRPFPIDAQIVAR